jgi:hypothetical protein
MSKLHPPYEVIVASKPSPTKGELIAIEFLRDNLSDEYEVFYQPFLNGDLPDIVLMRKGGGVMIIEVKDWSLDSYHLDYRKRWFVSYNNALTKSPISQVLQYKENMYNLHIENLLALQLRDYKYWFIVNCAVFFSKETTSDIRNFLFTPFEQHREFVKNKNGDKNALDEIDKAEESYTTFLNKSVDIIGIDRLTKEKFSEILFNRWISRESYYFKDNLYESFKRYLKPSFHSLNEGKEFNYTTRQKQFSESKPGEQKIKGIVGSGKTQVLAKRAVNGLKRTNGNVLVLTYNISLKNYIHDKISNVREDFNWSFFHIVNYHDFFNSVLNNLGIQFDIPNGFDDWRNFEKEAFFNDNYYGNIELLDGFQEKIEKYPVILIDEIQDFKTIWLRIIKKFFLAKNGEFVVFGDSKQDIYDRVSLVNNKKELVIPDSPGRWAELNQSFRLTPTITAFASSFQKQFLIDKHKIDEFENLDFQAALFDKVHFKQFLQFDPGEITDFVISFSKTHKVHPNDICVLSLSIECIREIDELFRKKTKEKPYIMSETKEYYDHLKEQLGNTKTFSKEIDKIRKNKKLHFWMNSGLTKFSTIHSYKGWEIDTLFLIVQNDAFEATYRELVYTGFTRCMRNLVILNINDVELQRFSDGLQIIQREA